ncbi:MAG: hypothetical protein ABEJ65_09370 [bacterium]
MNRVRKQVFVFSIALLFVLIVTSAPSNAYTRKFVTEKKQFSYAIQPNWTQGPIKKRQFTLSTDFFLEKSLQKSVIVDTVTIRYPNEIQVTRQHDTYLVRSAPDYITYNFDRGDTSGEIHFDYNETLARWDGIMTGVDMNVPSKINVSGEIQVIFYWKLGENGANQKFVRTKKLAIQ